ncbi:MAG: hypothetical protein AABY62_04080 [Pseudomonadota bacterium]
MRIYFISPWRVVSFAALGLAAGIWVAYGAGGLPIEHRFAPIIVAVSVLFCVAVIFQAVIITKGAIYLRAEFPSPAVERIAYGKIKSITLRSRKDPRAKATLWPAKTPRAIGLSGEEMLFLDIALKNEKKRRRIPLRLFGLRTREKLVQTLFERLTR